MTNAENQLLPHAEASVDLPVPWWQPILLAALAGGMGWGIRGQYGHETGAMIAGLLVSLVLVFLLCPSAGLLPAARAVAFGTIAIGIGGSMTYGQTVGLTQNAAVIGNWEAWGWGMLGLAITGAIGSVRRVFLAWAARVNTVASHGLVMAGIFTLYGSVAGPEFALRSRTRFAGFSFLLPGTGSLTLGPNSGRVQKSGVACCSRCSARGRGLAGFAATDSRATSRSGPC